MIDNALMWLRDFHVDGLRLDAVHALHDERATHLLEQLAVEVEALSAHLGRPLSLIAESDLNDAEAWSPRGRPAATACTAQWCDDIHHSLHAALTGEAQGYYADFATAGLTGLAHVLDRVFLHEGTWSSFRQRNHGAPVDTRRIPGPPVRRLPAEPRPDRQPRHRRPAHARPSPPACWPAGRRSCSARRSPRCCSWARSGARARRGSSSPTSPTRALREAVRDGRRGGVRRARLGLTGEVPDPNAEATFLDSTARLGRAGAGAARHPARAAPRADRAAPRPARSCPTRGSTRSRSTSTRTPAPSCCTAGGCGWRCNLGGEPGDARPARADRADPARLGAGRGRRGRAHPDARRRSRSPIA